MGNTFRTEAPGHKEVKWGQGGVKMITRGHFWQFRDGHLSGIQVYDFVRKSFFYNRLKYYRAMPLEKVVWLCIFIYSDSDLRESRFHFLHDCLHFLILILYHH